MNIYIKGYNFKAPTGFQIKKMSEIKGQFYTSGVLEFDADTSSYPSRSDEKIMRQDVKGSILIINEMIEALGLQNKIEDVPLYVANGVFVENSDKYLKRTVDVYKTFESDTSDSEKISRIYKSSPPLLALETLTNSTMSFIAQYTGMKGNNATFGNTSISALHALQEAKTALIDAPLSIVNSSHCGGDYSFLTNSSVLGYDDNWKESAGVACMLLSNNKDGVGSCLAKITIMRSGFKLPNLETKGIERSWLNLLSDSAADMLIYSGAFTLIEHDADMAYCKKINQNVFSWFDDYGNMGPSNIYFGILKAIEFVKNGCTIVDVLDRDIFGRESLIRVEKC